MQNKNRFLFFSLAGLLVALLLSAASIPASGDGNPGSRFYESQQDNLLSGSEQTSPCMALLMEAANKAGVKGTMGVPAHDVIEDGNYVCQVGFDEGGSGATILNLVESYPTPEDSFNYSIPEHVPSLHVQLTTFHGYSAMITGEKTEHPENIPPYTNEYRNIYWAMYKGGRFYYLFVSRDVIGIEKYGPADPLPVAEVLWSIAEDRLPLSEAPVDGAEQPALPLDPGEVVPGQPELPTDQTVPTETGGLFGIPAVIILGSLGIPIVGAVAGAVLSAILSGLSSVGVSPTELSEARDKLVNATDKLINNTYQKAVFYNKFDEIIKQKVAEKYYIKNPKFASNPDSPEWFPGIKETVDYTIALGGKQKGGRCAEATVWGKQWLEQIAKDTFGQDTFVGKIDVTREGLIENWDVNHRSLRLILPDGERIVPDVHESLIAEKAVLYNEQDWVEKYVKIIGGNTIVERSTEEDQIINQINKLGPEKGIKILKTKKEYKDNVPLYDLLIKSYLKQPCADPLPRKPLPVPDLTGLEGKPGSRR